MVKSETESVRHATESVRHATESVRQRLNHEEGTMERVSIRISNLALL